MSYGGNCPQSPSLETISVPQLPVAGDANAAVQKWNSPQVGQVNYSCCSAVVRWLRPVFISLVTFVTQLLSASEALFATMRYINWHLHLQLIVWGVSFTFFYEILVDSTLATL